MKLRTLIIGVVIATFCLTMVINIWSAQRLNTEVLIENTLETNRVYAQKLAATADRYIEETFRTLGFSANYIAEHLDDEQLLATEADRLRLQNKMFNSVTIADKNGLVLGVSPPSLDLKGQTLITQGPLEAMDKQVPIISKPYKSMTNRLVIFISHPIFNKAGDYIGLIGGSIYIKEDNIFYSLLGQHFYGDGSYVYVVDGDGRIIYHEDPSRLNEVVTNNEVVSKVINYESGAQAVKNTKGIDMLAGYSPIELANWGVVAQRPTESALAPVNTLIKTLLLYALPFLLLVLLFVLLVSVKIAQPLNQLAASTALNDETDTLDALRKIRGWYYEAYALKDTLINTLSILHHKVSHFKSQSTTDPLTGLTNRRTMDETLKSWTNDNIPYAILLVDLDRFKSVNDTYGHQVGDEVLKYLAEMMKKHASTDTVCCRFGGEEFLMIIPYTTADEAFKMAENLRLDLEHTTSPCGRPVTMSGGIALFPSSADSAKQVIELADSALYKAKQNGRNQVIIAE